MPFWDEKITVKRAFDKLLPHPVLSVNLLLVWLLLMKSVTPGHIVLGAMLGVLIPWRRRGYGWKRPVFIVHA